jgi:hypothetical protein
MILFNRVVMKEVLLKDHKTDTMLHAPSLVATLKTFNRSARKIRLSRLSFEDATIRLATDTTRELNLKILIDEFRKKPDSASQNKWTVQFEAIDLNHSRFILDHKFKYREVPYGINFTDLRIEDMDLHIQGFRIENDTIGFNIDHLSFREKSGFKMDHLEASVFLHKEFFLWRDLDFRTAHSNVRAERIDFHFGQWKDFGQGGFLSKVDISYRFLPSGFHLNDVSYFARVFRNVDRTVIMQGDLRGRINSLKGNDLLLTYGDNSHFSGNFDLIGLPDFQETYMYFDIEDLTTSISDIESMQIQGETGDPVRFSENLRDLGTISYRGKYVGFYNDFVTYGSFTTDMGNISSDLSIRPDTADNVHFKGRIRTEGFELGQLADNEELAGKLSMTGNVEGTSYVGGDLSARMDGSVSLLELNGYAYQNIDLAGDLSNRMFDGSFSITDPNLRMEFFGKIDFTDTLPVFDFTASVDKAMLFPLNLATSDPSYTLSCYLRANFIGANLDDFDGEINLVNSLFQKKDKQIQIYDFNLYAHHRPDSNQLILRSDLVDAEIRGTYEFEDIEKAAVNLLVRHIPSFRNMMPVSADSDSSLNNFKFAFHFKNTFPITDFFYPEVEIARNSEVTGHYYPGIYAFNLTGIFDHLRWKANKFQDLVLEFRSDSVMAGLETITSRITTNSPVNLENFHLRAQAEQDEFFYRVEWDNRRDAELYKGSLGGKAGFELRQEKQLPRIDFALNEGTLVMADTVWHVAPSSVTVDTGHIHIDRFSISHRSQALSAHGNISRHPDDKLDLEFRNLKLSQINKAFDGIEFQGVLNGKSTISGVFEDLVFISDISIDSLYMNRELLGNTSMQTRWIDAEQKIEVDMGILRGNLQTLGIRGDYIPSGKELDFEITLNKLKINVLQPFLAKNVSDLEGISNGILALTGSVNQPVLNGYLDVQKTSLIVNYLQTMYSLSDRIELKNNDILLDNLEVFDEKGSRAILKGTIRMDDLRNPRFDLNLEAENFKFLGTREVHNPSFYGDANATGRIAFTGGKGNLRLAASARTERGTHIFIPINQGRDIQENHFISFIQEGERRTSENNEIEYSVERGGFYLDFNLEVTEDATTEIIFDPQVGDILQASGNGNLQLSLDPQNGFQMFGEYTIFSGEYLFTLQNIINKKLKIQRGGNINWNGNPTEALINLNAIYNAKAAPGILVPDPPDYLKKRMPVECHLIMEGNLLSPLISFNIILPTAEEETRNVVRNAITTEEELTKQFLSLLVINNFSSVATNTGGSQGGAGVGMAGVTASELLSNQLSNWLSQISNDFDIGVNYRPGDEISSDQVEVALSTQIFDDRVSIHTNVDVNTGNNAATAGTTTSTIAGDFDVEVKLTDNGRFRLKAYNRYNHDQLYKTSPYTQGVGFVYREDFNSFGELGKRYLDAITGKNRKKEQKASKPEGKESD